MSGKLNIKSELQEEIMEAVSFLDNFAGDIEKILELLESNETIDHTNDKVRSESISHLLKALESYSAKAYEDVDRHVHATIQKLQSQELLDFKDDKPRTEVKIKLSLARQKAIYNKESLTKLLGKITGKK